MVLPKLCPAVALSHQDGRHSAVALLLKAALMQVNDLHALGSLWSGKRNIYGYKIEMFYLNALQ
jgi:hypothetical protein